MFPPTGAGNTICAYGELIMDQVTVLKEGLIENGMIEAQVRVRRGGCAPNVLVASAALGAPSRFLGHSGTDPVSNDLAEQMQRIGVRIFGARRGRGAASLCLELPGGGISMIYDPGDSRSVLPSDVRSWWLKDAAVLHMNSHHLYAEESAPTFWRLIEMAQELKVPVSLDVSLSKRLAKFGVTEYREVLKQVRPAVLFANENEGAVLEVDRMFPDGVDVVVNHRGPKPTRVYMRDSEPFEVEVTPVDEVVDTVGAGDAFAGGFLVGWQQGRSLRACVELGHQMATATVQSGDVDHALEDIGLEEDRMN